MAVTLYYSIVPGYCISVDEKLLSFQNIWYAQSLTNLVFCPHWSDHITLMPKYGHKATESVSIPNFFLISIQKMTWNNCAYLLPQAFFSTPLSRLVWYLHVQTIQFFHDGSFYHIKTSPLICSSNQWTGFYMTGTSVMKKLNQEKHIKFS